MQRAVSVGSVDRIVPASELRPYLIDAVERGMRRTLEQIAGQGVHRLEPAADVVEPARRRVAG